MMQCNRSTVLAGLVTAALVVACGPSGPTEQELAQEAEWTWLQETKQTLDAKRQELAELAAQPVEEGAEAAEGEEGEEGEVEGAPTDVEALETEISELAEEFGGRLVGFLNADPMIEGEPPTERQMAALRMKSAEDMVLAREWIEKGGDYRKAISIYQTALSFDPDNEALKAALEEAEAMRYMTPERFAAAKKGMTEDEVREILGQVNLHNIREFPDRGVVAWFYATGEGGAAAAVWFREERGRKVVYRLKFDEVTARQQEEG